MKKSSSSSHPLASQIMWAIFIVLVALWVIAYVAHLSGGLITYLLLISAMILFIRFAGNRSRTGPVQQRKAEAAPRSEAA
jgi:hypothetical protein